MTSRVKALILDLGGVLLDWDQTSTGLSSSQLRMMMNSTVWYELDRGNVILGHACEQFGSMLNVEPEVIEESLYQAQKSLRPSPQVVRMIEELKELDPDLQLYVMSNISREHFAVVKKLDLPWSLFNETFASGHVGMRKPDLCFFKHVLDQINCRPEQVVMIDDQPENICAARSMGIHGLLMAKPESLAVIWQHLRNMVQSAIPRAEAYLKANRGNHHCTVEGHDCTLKDNFAQLLIWEITHDPDIVYLKWPSGKLHPSSDTASEPSDDSAPDFVRTDVRNGLWNYFYEDPILTTKEFPADADTTSTAYLALPTEYLSEVADVHLVLDAMASNRDADGIMQTYFCTDRPRTSPEVCVNIIRAFYRFGRGSDPRIRETEDWVIRCLETRACLYGNRVYSTPETFLYFTARLYVECGEGRLKSRLHGIQDALYEQLNTTTNPLSLALRVASCQTIGINRAFYAQDLRRLAVLQEQDGGFPAGHFCRMGRTGAKIGNRGLTTALAVKILRHEESLDS
ncbi:HAD-like protein [Aspergillus californicus]